MFLQSSLESSSGYSEMNQQHLLLELHQGKLRIAVWGAPKIVWLELPGDTEARSYTERYGGRLH